MWFSSKQTLIKQGIFQGFTDHHSHILPGVDDGVKTMEDAIAIITDYTQLGVKEIWLTPHIQEFMPNTTEHLNDVFQQLQSQVSGVQNCPTIHLAAEYMLDPLFTERLKAKELLFHSLPGKEPRLLVETSYFCPPMGFWDIIREIMSQGIRPILAHPERYRYMTSEDYSRLHDMGVILQMNLPSILGFYGKDACKRANKLLKCGFYSLYGTDIHSKELLHMLHKEKTSPIDIT